MKRNTQKMAEAGGEGPDLQIVEEASQGRDTTPIRLQSHQAKNRPEIAVLGWDARSYRLSLRASKI